MKRTVAVSIVLIAVSLQMLLTPKVIFATEQQAVNTNTFEFTVLDTKKGFLRSAFDDAGWWVEIVCRQVGGDWRVTVKKWSGRDKEEFKRFNCLVVDDRITMSYDGKAWHLVSGPPCS